MTTRNQLTFFHGQLDIVGAQRQGWSIAYRSCKWPKSIVAITTRPNHAQHPSKGATLEQIRADGWRVLHENELEGQPEQWLRVEYGDNPNADSLVTFSWPKR